MEKKYCSIHHLYYTGNHCPMCLKESSEALSNKFVVNLKPIKTKTEKKEITADAIAALKAKFNSK